MRQASAFPAVSFVMVLLSACSASGLLASGSPDGQASATPISSLATALPPWCPGPAPGGRPPAPGESPQPARTIDLNQLLCIEIENNSTVDMAMEEALTGGGGNWSLLPACSGSRGWEPTVPTWSLKVGRATAGGIDSPILARIDSTQLNGSAPYLIRVIIDPDAGVTIRQTDRLPDIPPAAFC